MTKKISVILCVMIIISMLFSSCSSAQNELSFTAMDTYVTLKANVSKNNLEKIKSMIEKLSGELDSVNDSELFRLNNAGGGECGEDVYDAIRTAVSYYNITDHAYNPCLSELKTAWGFDDGKIKIPTEEEIKNALKSSDCGKIIISGKNVELNGAKLDLGGVAKGIAADKAADMLKSFGCNSGIFSIGGTIAAVGSKNDNQSWTVSIQDPRGDSGKMIGTLKLKSKFVSTSGDYQQYKIIEGKRYHHIFGENGYPTDNGIISVTVVSSNGAESDALSTALFVMGKQKAFEFLDAHSGVKAMIVTDDKKVTITKNMNRLFTLENNEYELEIH